jgi:hypothetical protein
MCCKVFFGNLKVSLVFDFLKSMIHFVLMKNQNISCFVGNS